jgi:hypothetical protein
MSIHMDNCVMQSFIKGFQLLTLISIDVIIPNFDYIE